jgi:predicted transcriptional regulator
MARAASRSTVRRGVGPGPVRVAPDPLSPEQALGALGFTDTEAAVYCELLRAAPSTGYRLAHAIGKAPANVYQALAALSQKGAVLVDDKDARTYRATPPDELLAMMQQGFDGRATEARTALDRLHAPVADDRLYQLSTADQVYGRASAMIDRACEILLFDFFPAPFSRLRPRLEAAAARGVTVAGIVYEAVGDCRFTTAVSPGGPPVVDGWPGLQLGVVADAREHLSALLSRDETQVKHGVWSDSVYLACLEHNGLACEVWVSMASRSPQPHPFSLFTTNPPGLRALLGQSGADRKGRS